MKRDTIKKHEDFATDENAPTARCAYFMIRAKKTKFKDDARFGLIVSKKTFKYAVDRNRAKRLIRDWIAYNEDLMNPDWDYVFIARKDVFGADRESGRNAMMKALRYMQKLSINE